MSSKFLFKNGRRHSMKTKQKAKDLRSKGLTHREIVKELNIGLGSAWLWTKGMTLTLEQKKAAQKRNAKFTFTEERRKKLSDLARANFMLYWKQPYSKKELINKIKKFYFKKKRILSKGRIKTY